MTRKTETGFRIVRALLAAVCFLGINHAALAAGPDTPAVNGTDKGTAGAPEQRAERRKAMREHWQQLSPEERHEIRSKMQQRWEKMSPEERQTRRNAMREHWKEMSPEERDQFKRDMGKQDKK